MTEQLDHPAQKLWQSQPVEATRMSAEAIRKRADKFEQRIRRRNVREYVGSMLSAIVFVYFIVQSHDVLFRIAYGMFIAGMAVMVVQLYRKSAPRRMSGDMGASTCLQFFREELERQRDVVKNVWAWYLAPLVPGFVLLTVATLIGVPFPASLRKVVLMNVFVGGVFFLVWKLNMRAARCLQRTIDELYAAENQR
jgi:Flp pilus assembly protein TadB